MALDNDYKVLQNREIAELRKDVQVLQQARQPANSQSPDPGLRDSIDRLEHSISDLIMLFKGAAADMRERPDDHASIELGEKVDTLIRHNEDIAKAILLLLELNREHLPQISRHTKLSSALLRQQDSARVQVRVQEQPSPQQMPQQQRMAPMPRPPIAPQRPPVAPRYGQQQPYPEQEDDSELPMIDQGQRKMY